MRQENPRESAKPIIRYQTDGVSAVTAAFP